ncbi:heme exporter protein CcmD [Paracoccus aurantiacus]|uniref:Heme exporter protein D n=1 Tax=Paracoccus aurantiacus TaxID=2599412 RepID=A0A5C6S8G6_9RHOB|nr:heme exporter protein CcmD [Paracoccus aurantiacus]TXB70052.1 heme exporter protein CcmD [Paracoccus aurantiacus]
MTELGKYAVPVLLSYGVGLTLLALLIWNTLSRNARARHALEQQEGERDAR